MGIWLFGDIPCCHSSSRTQLRQIAKFRQKIKFKNSWKWLVIAIHATVWHFFFRYETMQRLKSKIICSCWNLFGKFVNKRGTYFLAGFSHSEPMCSTATSHQPVPRARLCASGRLAWWYSTQNRKPILFDCCLSTVSLPANVVVLLSFYGFGGYCCVLPTT